MTKIEFFKQYLFGASQYPKEEEYISDFESYLNLGRIIPIGNNLFTFTYLGTYRFLNELKVDDPDGYNMLMEQLSVRTPFLMCVIRHIAQNTATGAAIEMIEGQYVRDIEEIERDGVNAIKLGLAEPVVAPLVNAKRNEAVQKRHYSVIQFVNSVSLE